MQNANKNETTLNLYKRTYKNKKEGSKLCTFPGVLVLGLAEMEGTAVISNAIPPMTTGSDSPCFKCPPVTNTYSPTKKPKLWNWNFLKNKKQFKKKKLNELKLKSPVQEG